MPRCTIDLKRYRVHTGGPGIHLSHQVNMAGDILVYEKSVLTPDKISRRYADVPPKVVIEVDISIEAEGFTEMGYVFQKSGKLMEFGCEKVIWVLTEIQKVVVFTPGTEATVLSWNDDICIFDTITFNVGRHLDSEGISI